jgi:hypothetical protein
MEQLMEPLNPMGLSQTALAERCRILERENTILLERLDRDAREKSNTIFEIQEAHSAERRRLEGELTAAMLRGEQLEQSLLSATTDRLTMHRQALDSAAAAEREEENAHRLEVPHPMCAAV